MSLVSSTSGFARFLPFSQHHQAAEARLRCADAAKAHANKGGGSSETMEHNVGGENVGGGATEIAAIEFADAFAQFNFDSVLHQRAVQQQQSQACSTANNSPTKLTALHTFTSAVSRSADEHLSIAFAEEATASTSFCDNATALSANAINNNRGCSGGLKRTVSSLHFRGGSLASTGVASRCSSTASSPMAEQPQLQPQTCVYTNQPNNCMVEAKQVEIEFVTLSGSNFQLIVYAPNGEKKKIDFDYYGRTATFSPCRSGCGHGLWRFEIRTAATINSSKKTIKEESIYLDGVGSLFFSIDEQLRLRLSSQQFLRLPSASRCCGNATAAALTKRSATQPALS